MHEERVLGVRGHPQPRDATSVDRCVPQDDRLRGSQCKHRHAWCAGLRGSSFRVSMGAGLPHPPIGEARAQAATAARRHAESLHGSRGVKKAVRCWSRRAWFPRADRRIDSSSNSRCGALCGGHGVRWTTTARAGGTRSDEYQQLPQVKDQVTLTRPIAVGALPPRERREVTAGRVVDSRRRTRSHRDRGGGVTTAAQGFWQRGRRSRTTQVVNLLYFTRACTALACPARDAMADRGLIA